MSDVKTKVIDAKDGESIMDAFHDILTEVGYEDVILVASKGKGEKFTSLIKTTNLTKAMAQIGMLIKELAMNSDMRSDELAEMLRDNLKQAEDALEKLEKAKKKDKKKVKKIDIVVNEEQ